MGGSLSPVARLPDRPPVELSGIAGRETGDRRRPACFRDGAVSTRPDAAPLTGIEKPLKPSTHGSRKPAINSLMATGPAIYSRAYTQ